MTILREADQKPVSEVAKRHGVSDQTIYAWRQRYGTLEAADVKRLRGPVNQADASLTPLTATIAVERLNLATTGFLDPSAGLAACWT